MSGSTAMMQAYTTAVAIRKDLPSLDAQLDYGKRLSALKSFSKDKKYAIASLETDAALAQTLDEALKRGDVTCEGGVYRTTQGVVELHGQTVTRWRKVRCISPKDRRDYYDSANLPTRNGLLLPDVVERWVEVGGVVGGGLVDLSEFRKICRFPDYLANRL